MELLAGNYDRTGFEKYVALSGVDGRAKVYGGNRSPSRRRTRVRTMRPSDRKTGALSVVRSMIKRFIDPKDITTAIVEMETLAGSDRFVVAGGVAMQYYESQRFTRDVDFVMTERAAVPKGIKVLKQLTFGGICGLTPRGIPIDIIMRNDDFASLYEDAIKKAEKCDNDFYVVTPEHLAIMKMVAGRKKDELDLNFLVTREFFNTKKARKYALEFLGAYGAKEFDSIVAEAAWRQQRGEIE